MLSLVGSWIAIAWVTLSASLVGMLLGTVRFMFPNVLSEPPSTFKAGLADSYEEGKVEDKYKEVGSWVILYRDDSNRRIIYALSTTCTHLGCTPNWLESDKKFKCPCHGSGFKITGVNFEGPAPGRSNAGPSRNWKTARSWSISPASSRRNWASGTIRQVTFWSDVRLPGGTLRRP